MKILLIDNFDSFTYNLYDYLGQLGHQLVVCRNNIELSEFPNDCTHVVLSPGPGLPREAGNLMKIIDLYAAKIPILGVCLGHQAIAEYKGASLSNLELPYHGLQKEIEVLQHNSLLFKGLEPKQKVGLYHSWVVNEVPQDFVVTAKLHSNLIMAMEHSALKLHGVQFHPESIMTPKGLQMLKNFIELSNV